MKENRYDDEAFFEKYSQMNRSVQGLSGAGEWSELKKLLPDFAGKRVLDLGCGYGWHCIYAHDQKASYVLGTDISEKMLDTAKKKSEGKNIAYRRSAMEDLELEPESFDVVISSLAFHYVADFPAMVKKIEAWLVPGGEFVFSVEHPVFTAQGSQDWYYGEDGEILHFPVDNYYYEGKRDAVFLGEHVVKYHRTLTTYLNTLLDHGFCIRRIVEPQPPEEMMDLPGMKDEMRRPMMLLTAAQKRMDVKK
ncbi:MAG TPA: class I SAM-dependent methyltransferase [Candidatus Fimimorpha excrementavium]|nr:class I SAM-dependent methyltransferase [Candidatus Fimimorpha excrementavium]